jgi:hypothetical protein
MEPVIVGFTGTRKGMTSAQQDFMRQRMMVGAESGKIVGCVHGSCKGSDVDFHWIALAARLRIEAWPSTLTDTVGYCPRADVTHEPMDPIERDYIIVDQSNILMATPRGYKEELRSGTWLTIRYAMKQGKPVWVVWPDGVPERWNGQARERVR